MGCPEISDTSENSSVCCWGGSSWPLNSARTQLITSGRLAIVFAQDGRASEPPQHGNLPDVIERVGHSAIEFPSQAQIQRQLIVDLEVVL